MAGYYSTTKPTTLRLLVSAFLLNIFSRDLHPGSLCQIFPLVHIAGSDGGPTQDLVYSARESQLAERQPAKFVFSQSGGVTCIDQKEVCVRSGKPLERFDTFAPKTRPCFEPTYDSVLSATDLIHERTEKFLSVGASVVTLHQGSAPRVTCTSDDGAVICCAQQPGPDDDSPARTGFGLQCSTPGGISVELTSDAQVSDHTEKLAHRNTLVCAERR